MLNIKRNEYTVKIYTNNPDTLEVEISKVISSKLYRMVLYPNITTMKEVDEYLNINTLLNDKMFKRYATIAREVEND